MPVAVPTRFRYCLIWLVSATLLVHTWLNRSAAAADVADIRAAWSTYWKDVDTFQYEYEFTRTRTDRNQRSISLRTNATFSLSGNKIAYRIEGEEWDEATQKHSRERRIAAYDGSESKGWFDGTPPLGDIFGGRPSFELTNYVEHEALWFAFRPIEFLERQSFSVEQMHVARLDAERNGIKCIEVELPLPPRNILTVSIYVDPARNYLPLEYVQKRSGEISQTISIQYVRHDKVDWVVSNWIGRLFNVKGELKQTLSAHITKCSVNEPIPDTIFQITFPTGTRIVRKESEFSSSREYFLQLANGTLKAISPNEYSGVSAERPAKRTSPLARWLFVLSSVLVAVLLVALWARHYRKER